MNPQLTIDAGKPQPLVTLFISPNELRELADVADAAWKETSLGGDLCFFTLAIPGVILRMTVDQGKMRR